MSYTNITVEKTHSLVRKSLLEVKEDREVGKQVILENRISSRRKLLKLCPPLRLFYKELTPETAEFAGDGYNWWTTYDWDKEQAALAIKILADASDDGFVLVSHGHLINMRGE